MFTGEGNKDKKTTHKTKVNVEVTEKHIEEERLSDKSYEQIIKGFKDSELFAINNKEFDFIEGYLEEGSDFEKKKKEEISKQTVGQKLDYVKFMEFIKIKKNIHIVKAEVSINNVATTLVYQIKKSKTNYKIIDEEKN